MLLQFGSSVTGKPHKESDADIAYLSRRNLTIREEAEIIIRLMPVLKNKNIDLVNIHMASPLLLYALARDGRVIYESSPFEFYNLRAYAFKRYVEAKPLFELKAERMKINVNPVRELARGITPRARDSAASNGTFSNRVK